MTYAESRNAAPFDWNAFLNKETYTIDELADADELAASWVTCACGNQCDVIPRDVDGFPEDNELWHLGVAFAGDVGMMQHSCIVNDSIDLEYYRKEAKKTLSEIESRSAYLIQQINENK